MIASEYHKLTGYSKFSIFRSLDTQVSVRTRMTVMHACPDRTRILNLVQYPDTFVLTRLTCTLVRSRIRGVALSLDPAVKLRVGTPEPCMGCCTEP